MSKRYADFKASLALRLEELRRLAEERRSGDVADGAAALAKKLADDSFNVVVLGEFKRGKTTFVNALLGAEVLPAAIVPLTSIVTAVTWGERPRAEIIFTDGRREEVKVADLPRYVTERGNPQNQLGVQRAVVCYPSEELRGGVFLVDTPGVGSIHEHNTEAVYAFIPQSDAAVFLTSADPPISAGERAFLDDIRDEACRLFFVLNKIDHLSPAEAEESHAFTEVVLTETVGSPVALYQVSARRALSAKMKGDRKALDASGLPAFERDFRIFLMNEKGRTLVASIGQHARKLIRDELNSIEIEQRALLLSAEELSVRGREMERVFDQTTVSSGDIKTLLRRDTEKLLAEVERDLDGLRSQSVLVLADAAAFVAAEPEPREAAARFEEHVRSLVRKQIDDWRTQEDRKIAAAFHDVAERFVAQTNELVEGTVRLCAEFLDLSLTTVSTPNVLAGDARFSYFFFRGVPTLIESLLPDLNRFRSQESARKRLLKDAHERIPSLLDKHAGRLRWDFQQRLERSRLELQRTLDQRLNATIASLRLGIVRASEKRALSNRDAEESQTSTKAAVVALRRIDAGLKRVLRDVTAKSRR
ncbi:MAG: dynamin family protein [Actinomycetota bacterium]